MTQGQAMKVNLMKGYNHPDIIATLFNYSAISHTITSADGYSGILGEKFDSYIIEPGGNYTFVFTGDGLISTTASEVQHHGQDVVWSRAISQSP